MASPQKPSIGRIVHYHSYGTPGGEFKPEPRAAIVTKVHEDDPTFDLHTQEPMQLTVDLCVLNPTGIFFNQRVKYSLEPMPGRWSWPPRT